MILIADSGSTKTDWGLIAPSLDIRFTTSGLNPYHQDRHQMESVLQEVSNRVTACQSDKYDSLSVYFYGSGVRPEQEAPMADFLRKTLPVVEAVEAHSDLLGAARALCGHNCGIASILGTGANSCLYDGNCILQNTPALGYILGDEGSGAVLGKRFLHDLYGGVLSEELRADFEYETGLSLPQIIDRIYRQPLANRFLASLSEFIHSHLSDSAVEALVCQNFTDFIHLHIDPYGRKDLPLSFVGSIAYYYREQLVKVVSDLEYTFGTVLRSPIDGLVRYHVC